MRRYFHPVHVETSEEVDVVVRRIAAATGPFWFRTQFVGMTRPSQVRLATRGHVLATYAPVLSARIVRLQDRTVLHGDIRIRVIGLSPLGLMPLMFLLLPLLWAGPASIALMIGIAAVFAASYAISRRRQLPQFMPSAARLADEVATLLGTEAFQPDRPGASDDPRASTTAPHETQR